MNLAPVWKAIEGWQLSAAMRGDLPNTEWLFLVAETLHVMAITTVFGSIVMVDLRLLGISWRNTRVSKLSEEILPWTWTAWCLAALFGSLMFVAKPVAYSGNLQFRLKFVCMLLAAVNMLVFQFGAFRRVAEWDEGTTPFRAKLAGAISVSLWMAVVFFGRWTGFTT
jgi:hypothetical protein